MAPLSLNDAQQAAINLGLFIACAGSALGTFFLVLRIIEWFRPKETLASKSELLALEAKITGIDDKLDLLNAAIPKEALAAKDELIALEAKVANVDGKFDRLNATFQLGFNELTRAIGRLEGKFDGVRNRE
jgi:hypothetical protein